MSQSRKWRVISFLKFSTWRKSSPTTSTIKTPVLLNQQCSFKLGNRKISLAHTLHACTSHCNCIMIDIHKCCTRILISKSLGMWIIGHQIKRINYRHMRAQHHIVYIEFYCKKMDSANFYKPSFCSFFLKTSSVSFVFIVSWNWACS